MKKKFSMSSVINRNILTPWRQKSKLCGQFCVCIFRCFRKTQRHSSFILWTSRLTTECCVTFQKRTFFLENSTSTTICFRSQFLVLKRRKLFLLCERKKFLFLKIFQAFQQILEKKKKNIWNEASLNVITGSFIYSIISSSFFVSLKKNFLEVSNFFLWTFFSQFFFTQRKTFALFTTFYRVFHFFRTIK